MYNLPSSAGLQHRPALGLFGLLSLLALGVAACGPEDLDQPGDRDQDGASESEDCDDQDPAVHPGASELCDGKDNNCNGQIDEGVTTTWYLDADHDGYGQTEFYALQACAAPTNYVARAGDCNDNDPDINPEALERCNQLDDDCDLSIDEGLGQAWYPDQDEDGFGAGEALEACAAPAGYVSNDQDCDDTDPDLSPETVWYADSDGDGFGDAGSPIQQCTQPDGYVIDDSDCDDSSSIVYPGADEQCDGKTDFNCDGKITQGTPTTYYPDADADGYGRTDEAVIACELPAGYALNGGDCDDYNAALHPDATETCDQVDNNCDGNVDEGLSLSYYPDADHDGYGDSSNPYVSCQPPAGYISQGGDCNDADAQMYPGAPEYCDGKDNDCNGIVDDYQDQNFYPDNDGDGYGQDIAPTVACVPPAGYVSNNEDCDDTDPRINPNTVWYPDADGDGYGTPPTSITQCEQPAGYALSFRDCNDSDPAINPLAIEVCDGIDNNCDGQIDEDLLTSYYQDADGDGYGTTSSETPACTQPSGYTPQPGDCNDADPSINPGATELCDGIDNNCDGTKDENLPALPPTDKDGDGFEYWTGTPCTEDNGYSAKRGDCDDNNPAIHPGANDPASDGIDQDCGGTTGPDPHVALSSSSKASIAAALSAARDGMTVWVGPGTFKEFNLSFGGKAVRLLSTQLAKTTTIDAQGKGRVFQIDHGEGSGTEINGFSLINGFADKGGGLFLSFSSPKIVGCVLRDNSVAVSDVSSTALGGGIYMTQSDPTLRNCVFAGNQADGKNSYAYGGALYLTSSSPVVTQCTFVDNAADFGGGIYVLDSESRPTLQNSVLAYNPGYNVFNLNGLLEVSYSTLYAPVGMNHNLSLEPDSDTSEPRFVHYTNNRDHSDDDFHLAPGSLLIDAGDPGTQDPDGSRADRGAYGGSGASFGYYQDQDADGMYDGWEDANGLNKTKNDAALDLDADGATNLEEFKALSSPQTQDSDKDGARDGAEIHGGSSPVDWYSQPGVTGVAVATVPGSFASIQAAIDAIWASGSISVAAGTWKENVKVVSRRATITAPAGSSTTILQGSAESAVTATAAELNLKGFKVTGGNSWLGGGLHLAGVEGALENLLVTGNQATSGGGLFMEDSTPSITGCTFSANSASRGAGLYLMGSSPLLTQLTISQNTAGEEGGGLYFDTSSGALWSSSIAGNHASHGGGLYLSYSSPGIHNLTVTENQGAGAGLFLWHSSPEIENALVSSNLSQGVGGGLYLSYSSPAVTNSTIVGNTATSGGGMYLEYSSSMPSILNVILASNSGYNLYNSPASPAAPAIAYSDLYNPSGANHNLGSLAASNLSVDPKFVSYSNNGSSKDDDVHLAPGSPLIDTGDPALSDPDGSRSDQGLYGGPLAVSTNNDVDHDGMYDSWELENGLNPSIDDSKLDPDADGATNLEEFLYGTDPHVADTDGDGVKDGAEIDAGSSPADWYSQPGVSGVATAHVPGSFSTIQAAIDAIKTEGIVQVGPGTWKESLEITLKTVTLTSSGGAASTILQGVGGSVLTASQATLHMSGFTVTGGDADLGGGMLLSGVQGDLSGLKIQGNTAYSGGGLYLESSSPTLTGCTISDNSADQSGGGLYLSASSPTLSGCTIADNVAQSNGGGLYLGLSDAVLNDSTISGNTVRGDGGGLAADDSDPSISRCELSANSARSGGGLRLTRSNPVLSRLKVIDNVATAGGGFRLEYSDPTIANSIFVANFATSGGAMSVSYSSPAVTSCTLSGNSAVYGGGMDISGYVSTPAVTQTLLALNFGLNVRNNPSDPGAPTFTWSDLYDASGENHNLSSLDSTNLSVDPKFVRFSNDLESTNDEVHLRPGSPLINAGDPSLKDPDGSRADIGAYGGPTADFSYYQDADADGLYDGWELEHGLNPGKNDSSSDPDADGASNLKELGSGSDPGVKDTDGDGALDGAEISAGSDPADWYSQPNVAGVAVAKIPGSFTTIQGAIDAITTQGSLEVGPGTWTESLHITSKRLTLVSRDGAAKTTLKGVSGPVVSAVESRLTLHGFTITGGNGNTGGGVYLEGTEGTIRDLTVTGNQASQGGGIYVGDSSPAIASCTLSSNKASKEGGGIYLRLASPSISNCRLTGNSASDVGGGISMSSSTPTLSQVNLSANDAVNRGGGVYLSASSATLKNCIVANNTASATSSMGGGLYLSTSSPVIVNSAVTGNKASLGGGIYLVYEAARPSVVNTVLAFNSSYNFYNDPTYPGTPTVTWSDLYVSSGANHNLSGLSASVLTVEPKFMAYDAQGRPSDFHLSQSSSLIDQGDPSILDPGGSVSDPGPYGGPGGDEWDLDGDGYPAYFWPGSISTPPKGYSSANYDADDGNAAVH